MKRLWFFDLDGTIADTDADIRLAWKAALADLELECPAFERLFVAGPTLEDMFRILFPEIYTEELAAKFKARYLEHYINDGFTLTREYPGVIDRVKALRAAGDVVVIATNKRLAGAQRMYKQFGWDQVFDGLFTGDMYAEDPMIGKLTKTQLLKLIMERFGVEPSQCVMVGDTIGDFNAAADNGVYSVGVTWGYGEKADLEKSNRRVDNAEEI